MKAFAAAVVFSLGLAVIASVVLNENFQQATYSAFTTEGARVDAPGTNLIGN
ncbi:MAG: hypothetical protein ACXIU7_06110 [Roseinatronobacter sp.]